MIRPIGLGGSWFEVIFAANSTWGLTGQVPPPLRTAVPRSDRVGASGSTTDLCVFS